MKKLNIFIIFIFFLILIISIPDLFKFKSYDISADKRFTLSDTTISAIKKINSPVEIDILLDGSMPNYYYTFQDKIRNVIELFVNENSLISYNFINPYELNQNDLILKKISDFGLSPEVLLINKNNNRKEFKLYPWALINYNNKSVKVKLIENKIGDSEEEKIVRSISLLENKLIDGLIKLTVKNKSKLSFLNSHGTSDEIKIFDFKNSLSHYYDISNFDLKKYNFNINEALSFLEDKKILIISNPSQIFNETEKLILDQFSLNGGKIIWLINSVNISLEMLYNDQSKALAIANELNLDDLFFHNGFKIKKELIKDLYCAPIVVATQSNNTQYIPYLWLYYPLVKHKNSFDNSHLNILTKFVSPIDTVKTYLNKKVILSSSYYTKTLAIPNFIDLNEINDEIIPSSFENKNHIIGIELNGNFKSFYKNKIIDKNLETRINKGNSAWLIISDGSIAENQIDKNKPLKLGYDKWTNNNYSNKEFIINKVHEFTINKAFINSRNKTINNLLVDKVKLSENIDFWKYSSILYPIVLSLFIYFILIFYRKTF